MTDMVAATAKAAGYQTATVIARIVDLDVDAAGNTEKAAWKRYMTLALLAQAKAVDKKKLIEAVFGKAGKASKTFQNMWSMAEKGRNTVLGNRAWPDICLMPIDEAMDTVLLAINAHMSSLEVAGKNTYQEVCHLSPAEAAAKRDADKVTEAEAKQEAEAKAKSEAEAKANAEAQAQSEAASTPERDLIRDTLASLQGATADEIGALFGGLGLQLMELDRAKLIAIHGELAQVLANTATPATADVAIAA